MRAYVVEHPDGAFTQADLSRPTAAAGQVLIRVHASGVNPLDTKIRAGKAAHAKQPLLTGQGQAHHGEILRQVAALADSGKLIPLLNEKRFTPADLDAAYALVESGALGKVVVDL